MFIADEAHRNIVFVGREKELGILEEGYGRPSAFLIYGRRRIGKSSLIRQFAKDKRVLYLSCIEGSESENLQYFSEELSILKGKEASCQSLRAFLLQVAETAGDIPLVFAIDEYQYLLRAIPSASSYLQHFIDTTLPGTKCTLILCGSAVGVLMREGTDGARPLYGRFDRIIHLSQLSFDECRSFHPNMNDIDELRMYLTFGGVPRYHQWMRGDTYRQCIIDECIASDRVSDEARLVIGYEFRHADKVLAVMSAIAGGSVHLNLISDKTGIDNATCTQVLRELEAAGMVGTVNPMYGSPKRKSYMITDDLFAFYFGVVQRRKSLLLGNDPDSAYDALEETLNTFLGKRFELFCMDYITRNYSVLEIGKWWRSFKSGTTEEIDIAARTVFEGVKYDLFAECKFRGGKAGFSEYEDLERRVSLTDASNERLMIISASGFDEEFLRAAEGLSVITVGPDELFAGKHPHALRFDISKP